MVDLRSSVVTVTYQYSNNWVTLTSFYGGQMYVMTVRTHCSMLYPGWMMFILPVAQEFKH